MTKQNQLFEAIGSIDDDIAANAIKAAEKSKRKRPLRITAVAAASLAAALALAVGIRNLGGIIGNYISPADAPVKQGGVSYEASGFGKSEASLPNDSADNPNSEFTLDAEPPKYRLNVYPQNIIIPDSFKPDETEEYRRFRDLKMSPTDLFAEFGVSPLMNDNFTDSGEPSVTVTQVSIEFDYNLYNKNINKNVFFHTIYHTTDIGGAYGDIGDGKVMDMKDGNIVIISQNTATFAYDGVMYTVSVCGTLDDGNDYIMEVITDLGIL